VEGLESLRVELAIVLRRGDPIAAYSRGGGRHNYGRFKSSAIPRLAEEEERIARKYDMYPGWNFHEFEKDWERAGLAGKLTLAAACICRGGSAARGHPLSPARR
jgi:hypothetical protein